MDRNTTCCFTGHRPEKMNIPEHTVKIILEEAIKDAIKDGYTTFVTGMAKGVDLWAAEIVAELKHTYTNIKLICAIPYHGFGKGWAKEWKEKYNQALIDSDEIYLIAQNYSHGVFQQRNEWMIDHSSLVIAAYLGIPGGTRNTLQYAKKQMDYTIRHVLVNSDF